MNKLMMKKMAAILLAGTMMSMTACGNSTPQETEDSQSVTSEAQESVNEETEAMEEDVVGGWITEEQSEISEEAMAALNKALEGMEGTTYEPIRLLASQVVAGTDYAFLCRMTDVNPDAKSGYGIVYVYEDISGDIELMRVQELNASDEEETEGGWNAVVEDETIAAATAALEKAVDGLTGASYEPVAVLDYQIVGGTNYRILCKVTAVVPDAVSTYSLVTVYEDLEENAEIIDTEDLEYSLQESETMNKSEQTEYEQMIQTYRQALEEKWDIEKLIDAEISPLVLDEEEALDTIGYTLYDFDHDGTQELVIGYIPKDEDHDGCVLDVYTVVNGQVSHLFSSQEKHHYYITNLTDDEDYAFYSISYTGADQYEYNFYLLLDGEVKVNQGIRYNGEDSDPWKMGYEENGVLEYKDVIDEETAVGMMDSANDHQVHLDYRAFH